jgi:hypothetical protein
MNFFVNLPSDIMSSLGGNLKLSGCTAAKIFTGVPLCGACFRRLEAE